MHLLRSFVICSLLLTAKISVGQKLVRETYNSIFPNNAYLKEQRLHAQVDSLKKMQDSLLQILTNVERNNDILKAENELLRKQHQASITESLTMRELLRQEIEHLIDSVNYVRFPLVTCKEESIIPANEREQVTMQNTCIWNGYTFIEMGIPDKKGIYTWTTSISQYTEKDTILVELQDLFDSTRLTELELLINNRLKEDYEYMAANERHCFASLRVFPGYKLSDMRVSISENSTLSFEIRYGLSASCYELDYASALFRLEELRPFFKKQSLHN